MKVDISASSAMPLMAAPTVLRAVTSRPKLSRPIINECPYCLMDKPFAPELYQACGDCLELAKSWAETGAKPRPVSNLAHHLGLITPASLGVGRHG